MEQSFLVFHRLIIVGKQQLPKTFFSKLFTSLSPKLVFESIRKKINGISGEGSNGMIGKRLVELLDHKGANVYVADLPTDLRDRKTCKEA